jgi:hypothetical protein|nr:MAG TPA: PcfK-like protein [Caudoviricetes sp.]
MFEKFGEFDSSEELNKAAEGLLKEGDIESLKILAAENGIDKDDVEDYEIGLIDSLTTPLTAAYGKLDIETAQLNITEIMEDWMQYIRLQCLNDSKMASEVRKKGKTLKGCIAALIKWSFGHQYEIPADIIKASGISAGRVTLGIPGAGTAHRLIKEYYLGK